MGRGVYSKSALLLSTGPTHIPLHMQAGSQKGMCEKVFCGYLISYVFLLNAG